MITKDDAIALAATRRPVFFIKSKKTSGTWIGQCRVNGQCHTWKRNPFRFRLPMKYGFSDHFDITEETAIYFFLSAEDAAFQLQFQFPSRIETRKAPSPHPQPE